MSLRTVLSIVLCAAIPLCSVTAQGKGKSGHSATPAAAKKTTELFAVIQIGDKLEVVHKSAIETRRKDLAAEYRKAVTTYDAAKKAAAAKKEKFTEAMPKPQALRVLNETFKTEAEAKTFLEQQEKKEKDKDKPKADDGKGGKKGAQK
jgi:hypothetical protein